MIITPTSIMITCSLALVFLTLIFYNLNTQSQEVSITCLAGECTSGEELIVPTTEVKIAKGANELGKPPEVSFDDCKDRHDDCKVFQRQGECQKNPGWMIVNCPFSCSRCHLRDAKTRCRREFLNISTSPAFEPGGLHKMFSEIPSKFGDKYNITVHSESPWIVTFDNFLTNAESAALISTVEGSWERSTDTGEVNEYGETGRTLSTGRTSSNAWCRHKCESNPLVQNVIRKIEEVTTVPYMNYESFQILQYDIGQKYNAHHDMSPRQSLLTCGPRILTFFLYLSDVDEGGETGFPLLNMAVKPKRNRALLWPSVLDENPEFQDHRTTHEAKPIIKGKKYAANSWIHLYDFQKSNLWGCTGVFDQI